MYLLDTNLISESRKLASGRADPHVVAWMSATDPSLTRNIADFAYAGVALIDPWIVSPHRV